MTARSAEGRASYANRIVKLAVRPPGTGGDAAESMLLSATLTAANQNSTDAPGLYRSCPNGTPKFARRELTPSFSVHVFLLSLNAAEDDAVDIYRSSARQSGPDSLQSTDGAQ